jgi:ribulose-phosphate 3-epimerase
MSSPPIIDMLNKMSPCVSVGILTANMMSLGDEIEILEKAKIGLLHIDVMDGCFIPMTTVGPPFIKGLKTSLLKDVHLMIEDPISKLNDYVEAGADILTVHMESTPHIHRAMQMIGKMKNANDPNRGIVRGVGINPSTPVANLIPLLDEIDMITFLAINPGWSGQEFIESTKVRISEIQEIIELTGRKILIAVDGGISKKNISDIAGIGADVIVTGSAVFDGKTPYENAVFMLSQVQNTIVM